MKGSCKGNGRGHSLYEERRNGHSQKVKGDPTGDEFGNAPGKPQNISQVYEKRA